MPKFITGTELEEAIYDVIWEAEEKLLIVSPFIKLDKYFRELFEKHLRNDNLNITIVFGKNEGHVQRSLNKSDFDFFKQFPNINIVYVPNLHAKYYSNEARGVITSINLYDYSFKNNIEFGVLEDNSITDTINLIRGKSADLAAWHTCLDIAEKEELIFAKRPVYKVNSISKLLGKNYIESKVLHDLTNKFYSNYPSKSKTFKTILDFPEELNHKNISKLPQKGFCIRTGVEIHFNVERPFCYDAYKSWAKYKNPDYKEKYCHLTGKASNGNTSFNNPIYIK